MFVEKNSSNNSVGNRKERASICPLNATSNGFLYMCVPILSYIRSTVPLIDS
jgi:hypothetical protein